MSINIQLVEVPENELIANRQLSLPDSGGTIGRSYDCTIQLPDFNRQLSRVHAEVSVDKKGKYHVTDRSTNGLYVNETKLDAGRRVAILDGDVLKMGGYVLLISDMTSFFAEPEQDQDVHSEWGESPFSTDNVDQDDLAWPVGDMENREPPSPTKNSFSASNVMADDKMGYDPFDDELEMIEPGEAARPVMLDHVVENESQQVMRDSLQQLSRLVDQQSQQLDAISHDKIMDSIERAMDRFLEDLNPESQEEMFRDYISGWGNKDKKYWRLYRKQFNRKLEKKEFHRQFSALFVEELRGKN